MCDFFQCGKILRGKFNDELLVLSVCVCACVCLIYHELHKDETKFAETTRNLAKIWFSRSRGLIRTIFFHFQFSSRCYGGNSMFNFQLMPCCHIDISLLSYNAIFRTQRLWRYRQLLIQFRDKTVHFRLDTNRWRNIEMVDLCWREMEIIRSVN